MSSKPLTFGEFIGMSDTCSVLTEEVLTMLESIEPFKDQDAALVGRLDSGDFARAIVATHPDLKRKSMGIANAVLARLHAAGYGVKELEIQSSVPEIVIKQEASIEQMSLRKLIETALEDPDRKTEAWRRIAAHPDVIKASKRTTGLAWVINGKLDAGKTLSYIQAMGDQFSRKQLPNREVGEKLLTLGEALGVETRCYVHPLDGSLLRGADEFQIDWTQELDPETHKAAIYALRTRNKIHPGFNFAAVQALLKGGNEWSLIVSAYWSALDQQDSIALGVQIYQDPPAINLPEKPVLQMQEEALRDGGTVRRSAVLDEKYYENLVRNLSVGDETIQSYGRTIRASVYNNIFVGSYNTTFEDGVVAVESCTIGSYNVRGTVILPPGKRVNIQSYNVTINEVRCKSWHEVATRAKLI